MNWWKAYALDIESAVREIRAIANESTGVMGYHLNGELATWDELLNDSLFRMSEETLHARVKRSDEYISGKHVIENLRDVFYIKEHENTPITVQYTPVYGGVKYIREKKEQPTMDPNITQKEYREGRNEEEDRDFKWVTCVCCHGKKINKWRFGGGCPSCKGSGSIRVER